MGLLRTFAGYVALVAVFFYFLHGAVVGDLAIYLRNGPDVHLHGLAAWLVTVAPALICASLAVRAGLIEFASGTARRVTELGLLFGAGALLILVPGLQGGSL